LGSIQFEHPYLKDVRIPCPLDFIHKQVKLVVDRCLEVTDADDFDMVFTGPDNFRIAIAKEQPYKGNRDDIQKPYHWSSVNDYIHTAYKKDVVTCIGFEADDYLAFHREWETENVYFICTRDKDLNTCPGWHYRWACGAKQPEKLPHYIEPFEAHEFFLTQCLTGDSTDHIPGCGRKEEVMWGGKLVMRRKGVGPSAAVKLLKEGGSIGEKISIVREAYRSRFEGEDWEAILLENARLLYMGQKPNKLFDWSWITLDDLQLEKGSEDRSK
jgi:hypothetical protein